MFRETPKEVHFPALEVEVLEFWKAHQVYRRSLDRRRSAPRFVFYEGPPTANGMPHPGHCLTRAIKDLFPRYRTMRGYLCERKAGWDTHGLPVEVEVCKELGIHSKEEIEAYGIEPFIQKCQQSVWRYTQAWEELTERLGFWVDLSEAYATYHRYYVDSVWWSLKQLFDRKLLYQGYKIVWWWAQGGTALSSGEVGQGYRTVRDPSIYVRFPLQDEENLSLVVWTTTPWTLPSNQFAAVHPQLQYAIVRDETTDARYIVASDLVEPLAQKLKHEWTVERTLPGVELVGRRYQPPFDFYHATQGNSEGALAEGGSAHHGWRVVEADFVTVDTGTGIVHLAPAFGEADYGVLLREQERFQPGAGPPLLCAIDAAGRFTNDAPAFAGLWVKDADKPITHQLKERGLILHQEQYEHEYPFCWRAEEDPLIQFPRKSWFIKTTQFKELMLANNSRIGWLPEHIRDGRFGNFLESNVDWALSRERYWGTPLPIWQCETSGEQEAIGSFAELLAKPGLAGLEAWAAAKKAHPELPDDLQVHKPYIDAITYDSPFVPDSRMRRVTEVIDCWYDAGAMPFAQWGFPHRQAQRFTEQFPADFISEALDQTRGWFYSLLAISTLLFSENRDPSQQGNPSHSPLRADFPHPFRNCIVLGLMLSEWWESKSGKVYLSEEEARAESGKGYHHLVGKMSKSKRNYREPSEIFDRHGADALRWYFFANQAPWTSIRYSERAIKESIPEFLLRLWNVFSFFVLYANIDEFNPGSEITGQVGQADRDSLKRARSYRPIDQRSELDRWILSEMQRMVSGVVRHMDMYCNFDACALLHEFVDALSNWYVRRSRDRFWSTDKHDVDKLDAYWTLYECLITLTRAIAPFTPFLAEYMWRTLTGVFGERASGSVHWCDYPTPIADDADETLSARMEIAREICSKGRSARMEQKLKVRQPLAKVEVILAEDTHQDWLESHRPIIAEELNVKEVEFAADAREYIQYDVKPNFRLLGPRVGSRMPELKAELGKIDPQKLLAELEATGTGTVQFADGTKLELTREDLQVDLRARPGWAAAQGKGCVVVLSTELTPTLIREGYARDLVRYIQDRRKELDCDYTDRIAVTVGTDDEELRDAIRENIEYLQHETLATSLAVLPPTEVSGTELSIGDKPLQLLVQRLRGA